MYDLGVGPGKEKVPSLRIHPINLQGYKYHTQEALLKLHADTDFDILFLLETHARTRNRHCKARINEDTIRNTFSQWICHQIACPCESHNKWKGFHGVAILVRPGLEVESEFIIDLATKDIDHRQLAVTITGTDKQGNKMTAVLIAVHFKSGSGRRNDLERLVQMYSSIEYLMGRMDASIIGIIGDWNVCAERKTWGMVKKLFKSIGLRIESYIQLQGSRKKGDPKIWTHEFRGKPSYFIDHAAIKCKDGFYSKIKLIKKEEHEIKTDHPNFLQVDLHQGQPDATENVHPLSNFKLSCRLCGMNSNVKRIHHIFCPFSTKEAVVELLNTLRKNVKTQVRENKLKEKVDIIGTLYRRVNGYPGPSLDHSDLCITCGLYYDHKYRNEHYRTHTQGKFSFCSYCRITFSDVESCEMHKKMCKGKDAFKCDICMKGFPSRGPLRMHRMVHTKLKCHLCPRQFYIEQHLKSHIREHDATMSLQCIVCNKCFVTEELCKEHKRVFHPNFQCETCFGKFESEIDFKKHCCEDEKIFSQDKTFNCSECGVGCTSKWEVCRHIRIAHRDVEERRKAENVNYTCEYCGKSFGTCSSFWYHRQTHNNDKIYQCKECLAEFTTYKGYSKHLLAHRSKKHSCLECEKSFGARPILNRHVRNCHRLKKTHTCNICGKEIKWNLADHLLTHSTEKKFKCKVCGHQLRSSEQLRKHIARVHREGQRYECSVCQKTLTTKQGLQRHMVSQHGKAGSSWLLEMATCNICQKSVRHTKIKQHMVTHSSEKKYKCEVCSRAFTTSGNCLRHLKTHAGNHYIFNCNVCGQTATTKHNLKEHMIIHTKVGPHSCFQCSMAFASKSFLVRHEETHRIDKTYKCDHCGKCYKTYIGLCAHRRSLIVHQCEKCKRNYKGLKGLKLHKCLPT